MKIILVLGGNMEDLSYLPEFLEGIKDIEFSLKSKLTKRDIKIIDILFNEYYGNKKISFNLKYIDLEKKLKLTEIDKLYDFFSNLLNKKISFKILTNNEETIEGEFHILNSIVKLKDGFHISLSREIIDCLDKNGFFYKYHLKNLIKLNKLNSIIFYKKIVLRLLIEKHMDISLKSLKELFSIDLESYTRFFDFDKYVLKPILDEIFTIDDFSISYEKIKTGDSKTNKILGLRFKISDIKSKEREENLNKLINFIKDEIEDFNLIYNILSRSLEEYSYDYILKNLEFAIKNPKVSFDKFLINSIEKNYSSMDYNDIYGGSNLIYDEEKIFDNISKFQNTIYDYMIGKNLYYSFNINFLNAIKNIKTKENLLFSDKNFKIIGTFNHGKTSYIKIYKL